MPHRHEKEISNPEAKQIWDALQKELIPYILSLLPDELFSTGREPELFIAVNRALYDKYIADGAYIPPDIQFRLQLDICHLMPAFVHLKNQDELLKTVFDPGKPTPGRAPGTGLLSPPVLAGKIVALDEVGAYREGLRKRGRKVVATNGCFDLLHVGHLKYLTDARALGDFLWVGLNGDASVRELKGPGRPLTPEAERAELLAAWRVVDAVTIFPGARATAFLRAVQPDVYAKGGDYTVDSLNAEEAQALRECGAQVEIVRLVPGKSTTQLVEKMAENKASTAAKP
ncbi:MAG TPA: adenylyltransferase/cytidyltransferase family protein [Candidatus Methylacidiphilales bacterium]|jgi:rfaE bifunctional protein nucleotidyltransferase chain/domain|nr:adenylyltransferase/cytidyltransferase family protein [Candidatus Methylacidiphilales bacterium]